MLSNSRFLVARLLMAASLIAPCIAGHALISVCVTNAADLQTQLATAVSANDDTLIKVATGLYQPTGQLEYGTSGSYSLTVEGGYNASCTSRSYDPGLTVIDGGHQVISTDTLVRLFNTGTGNITFHFLTVEHGVNSNYSFYVDTVAGNMAIENNRFLGNEITGGSGGAAYYFLSHTGSASIRNNLFVGTVLPADAGFDAIFIAAGDPGGATSAASYFTNNTVTGTIGNSTSGVGLSAYTFPAAPAMHLSNNIIWGNGYQDLVSYVAAFLDHNDIGVQPSNNAVPVSGSSGNVSVDPAFNGNYQALAAQIVNQGDAAAAGGVGSYDAAGRARIVQDNIDMGALEHDEIFGNGFEVAN